MQRGCRSLREYLGGGGGGFTTHEQLKIPNMYECMHARRRQLCMTTSMTTPCPVNVGAGMVLRCPSPGRQRLTEQSLGLHIWGQAE